MIELKACPCCNVLAPGGDCKTEQTKRIGAVLGTSAGDQNYDGALRRLDMEELIFVMAHESRKCGQRKIRRVLRDRGLTSGGIKLLEHAVARELGR